MSENTELLKFGKYILILLFTVIVWVGTWTLVDDIYHHLGLDKNNLWRGLLLMLIGFLGLYYLFIIFKFSQNLEINLL